MTATNETTAPRACACRDDDCPRLALATSPYCYHCHAAHTRRYVATLDHDSIVELTDVYAPDAVLAFQRLAADLDIDLRDIHVVPPLDNSLTWATYTFFAFDATDIDAATLYASPYAADPDDDPLTYVDYLRLRA